MINAIYIFSSEQELIFTRTYAKTMATKDVLANSVGLDCSFVEIGTETAIYKQFEDIIICFVVADENEIYVSALISMIASTIEKMLGCLDHKLLIYHFKDAYTLIDSFVVNGKVISLNPSEILSSVGMRSSS